MDEVTEKDYVPMALYIVASMPKIALPREDVISIAGAIYTKCKEKHDGRAYTWPTYLYRSMKNALIRESIKRLKRGVYNAPRNTVQVVSYEGMPKEEWEKWEPSVIVNYEENVLASELKDKIQTILGEEMAKVYLGKVMEDKSFRDLSKEMGYSHEWVRRIFVKAEERVNRAKELGVFNE